MTTLALTIGDPTGIGAEITAKALNRIHEFPNAQFAIIGALNGLMKTAASLNITLPQTRVTYHDIVTEKPGAVSYQAIETAVKMIKADEAQALVTAPISKKNLLDAGYKLHGHTEILEEMAQTIFNMSDARAEMLFIYKKFRLLLLTRHIPLRDVPAALAKQGSIARPLKTLIRFFRDTVKIDEPRIAILAPNPHSGEVGGDEEQKYIMPVIHAVNGVGASKLEGCFAADAFFRTFDPTTTPYDAVVAAYHDQGLIPFKLLAGYDAVNVTIGLPFIRTSVSHGTAEDIVGKGIAREDSLMAAIRTALDLCGQK